MVVKEGKIKVRIPETSNRWEPKQSGERLVGKYCKKTPTDFRGKKNFLYAVKTDNHPSADDEGFVVFFGTSVLNDTLGKISAGYDVDITFRGTKPSPDPKRKPKMLFDVELWLDPNDPILKKLYPDGLPGDIQKQIDELGDTTSGAAGDDLEPEKAEPGNGDLNTYDDIEVQAFVDGVEADIKGGGQPLTELNVWSTARSQVGDDKSFMELVKTEIRKRKYGN